MKSSALAPATFYRLSVHFFFFYAGGGGGGVEDGSPLLLKEDAPNGYPLQSIWTPEEQGWNPR